MAFTRAHGLTWGEAGRKRFYHFFFLLRSITFIIEGCPTSLKYNVLIYWIFLTLWVSPTYGKNRKLTSSGPFTAQYLGSIDQTTQVILEFKSETMYGDTDLATSVFGDFQFRVYRGWAVVVFSFEKPLYWDCVWSCLCFWNLALWSSLQ